MKKLRFAETQIVLILNQAQQGRKVGDISREYGISSAYFTGQYTARGVP